MYFCINLVATISQIASLKTFGYKRVLFSLVSDGESVIFHDIARGKKVAQKSSYTGTNLIQNSQRTQLHMWNRQGSP